jgi:alkylation response protein AidB-like acyl-CoA dehydrogenase
MRWLGQATRAFELMCDRLNSREAFGEPLAAKQLMQSHVFESYAQIQGARMLTLHAAAAIDRGEQARVEIGTIKVVGARMLHDVIDRAVQVHGAAGLTDDTPLSFMYRAARFARIYDGPDEVHVHTVARRILKQFRDGEGWDFAR